MSKMKIVKIILLLIATAQLNLLYGETYHVDQLEGKENNPGSKELPWRKLATANERLQPGDTLFIHAGKYFGEQIRPKNSGSPNKSIVYKAFPGDEVILMKIDTAIQLSGKSYIVIENIKINGEKICPHASVNSWVVMSNSKHCSIQNCDFRYANGWTGIHLADESNYNSIRNNYFDYCGSWDRNELWTVSVKNDSILANDSGDLVFIQCGRFNLIENNVLKHGGHDLIVLDDSYNIIRNNVFDNNWSEHAKNKGEYIGGRAGSFSARQNKNCSGGGTNQEAMGGYNLIENNIFTGTGWFPDAYRNQNLVVKVHGVNQIFRFNRIGNNIGFGISTTSRDVHPNNAKLKIYNNVVFENTDGAIQLRDFQSEDGAAEDLQYVNNLFYNNRKDPRKYNNRYDLYKDHDICVQLQWLAPDLRDNNSFHNNLIYNPEKAAFVYNEGNGKRNTLEWHQSNNPSFYENKESNPLFVSETLDINKPETFRLRVESQAIDNGSFLTIAAESGKGNRIKVADAGFFYAPVFTVYEKDWKHELEGSMEGDKIQIGANPPVQIVSINYDTNVIVLDKEVSWNKGDGVSLPYKGKKPDIGLFEN